VGASKRIELRQAQIADLAALNALESASFPSDQISARQMRYLLTRAKAHTLVATYKKQLVGYATLLLPAHPRPARLYSIAVDPKFRGQGIAGRLLAALGGIAKKHGYLRQRLEVRASDEATQALYRRVGFVQVKHLPGYYEDGEDALRMESPARA
jgi:ribosomal-protein-alanine acetyltransferase